MTRLATLPSSRTSTTAGGRRLPRSQDGGHRDGGGGRGQGRLDLHRGGGGTGAVFDPLHGHILDPVWTPWRLNASPPPSLG